MADDLIGPSFIPPSSLTTPPPTFRLSGRTAISLADKLPQVKHARSRYPDLMGVAYIAAPGVWDLEYVQASQYRSGHATPRAEVDLNGQTGRVLRLYVGRQANDPLARGHTAHLADAPWVWIPLCLLFVLPFVDFRRPRRLLHLDLAVLLSFGVSYWFLTRGATGGSVPLVYPVLAYLLGRMLYAGFRPRRRPERLVPHAPIGALLAGLALLIAFRVGINIANKAVLDAGEAGVVGAYRMLHHLPLWGHSPGHADTYGPLLYVAYVPFELVFPWKGHLSGTLGAAHAASITFDLLTMLGLFLLGSHLRAGRAGRRLGIALAYAWAAFPFTLVTLAVNENDALVAMLLTYTLVAIASPAGRGALLALAGAAKFSPLALIPVIAAGDGRRRWRQLVISAGTAVALFAVTIAIYLPPASDGGLKTFWTATLGFQMSRPTSFSLWAQHPALVPLQIVLELAAVVLAVVVAFRPRRRDPVQVAALAAAVLIATQLSVRHWFYFYIVWFAPYVLVALFGEHRTDAPPPPEEFPAAAIRSASTVQEA